MYTDELEKVSSRSARALDSQTHSEAQLLQFEEDVSKGVVMGVQLDLTRAVKQYVVFSQLLEALSKPFKVVLQLFKGIQDAAVRTEFVLLHDIFELDQTSDVEGARIVGVIVGWIEVDDRARAPDGAHELVHLAHEVSLVVLPGRSLSQETTTDLLPSQYVLLPAPGLPRMSCAKGIVNFEVLDRGSRVIARS